ncbi:MAG TPA: amidohydrolase [Candidatus Xenobia bacterium]|nr:amidohydrolase [Candidatus Xenobia bacterium]
MKLRIVLLTLALLLPISLAAQSPLEKMVEEELAWLLATYKHLHSHPELSYEEKETAAHIADELRQMAFEVTENVGKYEAPGRTSYGLVVVLRNGAGPTVWVRTDLDGLPVTENTGLPYASRVRVKVAAGETGVMHACGHDLHMSNFLGTAKLLTRMKDRWSGTLVLLGQPAEEVGGGAAAMLRDGLYERFPRPDFVIALHASASLPAGTVGVREGYALASADSVDIVVRGAGGHGAYPHTTKDPIVLASQIVLALQTIVSREIDPQDAAVITVGSFHAGTKHNIIPDEARLQLTIRSYKPEVRQKIISSIERISHGLAEAAGIPSNRFPTVTLSDGTPSTYNDPALTQRLAKVFEQTLGKERVIYTEPVMGAEDFSLYTLEGRQIPTSMFWLGAVAPERWKEAKEKGETLPSLHSAQFAPDAETALRTGVRAMTAAVLDLMKTPK